MLRVWLNWFFSPEDVYGIEDLSSGINVKILYINKIIYINI